MTVSLEAASIGPPCRRAFLGTEQRNLTTTTNQKSQLNSRSDGGAPILPSQDRTVRMTRGTSHSAQWRVPETTTPHPDKQPPLRGRLRAYKTPADDTHSKIKAMRI